VHDDAQVHAAEQVMLGLLHHAEEGDEVHDARGVGVAELDTAGGDEGSRQIYSPT